MSAPAALYVHLPWCVSKCPYCDFNSMAIDKEAFGDSQTGGYVEALIRDLDYERESWQGRTLASVFFGGGTPSLFPAADISRVLAKVEPRFSPNPEISLEANPDSSDSRRFKGYRDIGVNRLSIGVQSFSDSALRRLGRTHDGAAATRAFASAREAGFDNINLDLMYGLPGQDQEQAMQDLQTAISLQPEHISWYQLTLEKNTVFAAAPPPGIPGDESTLGMERQGHLLLAQAGYRRYEISAFSKPGRQCRHNLNYWNYGDYIGIGAGAHGKLTTASGGTVRTRRLSHPGHYMRKAGTAEAVARESLDASALVLEFAINALRLSDGFSERQFTESTRVSAERIREPLRQAVETGLLTRSGQAIRPTAKGLRFMDETLAIFSASQ